MAESTATTPKAFGVYLFSHKKTAEAVEAPSRVIKTQLKQGANESVSRRTTYTWPVFFLGKQRAMPVKVEY
jgi:hypothetical protein